MKYAQLGFDAGKKFGWAVSKDKKVLSSGAEEFESLLALKTLMQWLIQKYEVQLIVFAQGMGPQKKTHFQHGKMSGVLELLSETNNIAYIEPTDNQIRKNVWGEAPRIGRKALKEKAIAFTGAKSDDEADAIMASLIDPQTIFT